MGERALAHIEKVEWIRPIEGADNIQLVGILGWVCIAKIGEFSEGDLAVYIEIDSKCPEDDERFAFLAAKHYKVKTMKLGKFKVISQGLALPIGLFPELQSKPVGTDVTEVLKITYASEEDAARKSNKPADPNAKYKSMASRHPKVFSNPIIKKMMRTNMGKKILFRIFGKKKDNRYGFPSWIVKTDETRIENAPFYLKQRGVKWVKTEKLDGTSCTYALQRIGKSKKHPKFEFIVCSRNVRQMERDQETYHESNIYWELADLYNIRYVLETIARDTNADKVVIQGEGVGNVQGNPYKLETNRLYVFNIVIDGLRWDTMRMERTCRSFGLLSVPIIDPAYELPETMEEMKLEADGKSKINPNVMREGFVYRSLDGQQSFKNVSREYLLKHNG